MPSQVEDIEKIKASDEYQRLKTLLADREWRMDNLYWITDPDGNEAKFVRNAAQRDYWKSRWHRDVIAKARQLGFSTLIDIGILDACIFRSSTAAGIVDATLKDARAKLAKIAFAYERLPVYLKKAVPLTKANTEELHWANGSRVTVGTTYRGGTLQILHGSELGKTSVDSPSVAREFILGALRAVHQNGWGVVESTAHGTGGEFHDLVVRAEHKMAEGNELTPLDFKPHFYGWWIKPEYRLQNNLVNISIELREYLSEIEVKIGRKLDADQQAWYAKQYSDLGPDDIKSEFPSIREELFFNSLQGAYFKAEMSKARVEGRIGQLVPFDSTRRVNTFWDIGEDCTSIWFHQTDGLRHRFIDYYEEEGWSLQGACSFIQNKAKERGFIYAKHYGPHDIENREWGSNANTRVEIAKGLGVTFTPVPRVADKADSIEAARRMIGMSWFDSVHCGRGVECLDNYRKKWNERMGVFLSEPLHNGHSHGADALQQGAMGLTQDRPERTERRRSLETTRTSQWSA